MRGKRWIFFSLDNILATGAFYGFNNTVIEITAIHAKQDFQIIRFYLGNDFFNHFSRAVCGIRVAAAHKSSDKGFQFIAESKLQVETVIARLFGIESFDRTLLVAFHVDHTAVDINGDGVELALSQQLSKDLEVDLPQHVDCFLTEVSQKS